MYFKMTYKYFNTWPNIGIICITLQYNVIPDTSKTVKCSGPLLNSLNGAQNLETPLSVRQFFLRFKLFKLQ